LLTFIRTVGGVFAKFAVAAGIAIAVITRLNKVYQNWGKSQLELALASGTFAKEIDRALAPQERTLKIARALNKDYGNFIKKVKDLASAYENQVKALLAVDPKDVLTINKILSEIIEGSSERLGIEKVIEQKLKEQEETGNALEGIEKERYVRAQKLVELNRILSVVLAEHYNQLKLIEDSVERIKESTIVAIDKWVEDNGLIDLFDDIIMGKPHYDVLVDDPTNIKLKIEASNPDGFKIISQKQARFVKKHYDVNFLTNEV